MIGKMPTGVSITGQCYFVSYFPEVYLSMDLRLKMEVNFVAVNDMSETRKYLLNNTSWIFCACYLLT